MQLFQLHMPIPLYICHGENIFYTCRVDFCTEKGNGVEDGYDL